MTHSNTCPLLHVEVSLSPIIIDSVEPEQNFVLSEREAEAASPEYAVCGEEDPGEGLEFLVTSNTDD
jgi:hypothetical protein